MSRRSAPSAVSLVTLLLCCAPAHAGAAGAPPPPQFHVPGSSAAEQAALREGATLLASFAERAQAEAPGALRRLTGRRGCWAEAVDALHARCGALDEDASARLALSLANCQLSAAGQTAFPCAPAQPFKDCTKRMTDKAWTAYSVAASQATAVCFYLQAERFQADALASVDALHSASQLAAARVAALGDGLGEALAAQAALAASQAAVAEGLRGVADAQAGLEQLQVHALDGQRQLLSGQAALTASADVAAAQLGAISAATSASNETLTALFQAHAAAAAGTLARLQALSEGAAALEAAQTRFGAAQSELLASSQLVMQRQAALASTLDAVGTTLARLSFWQERCARGLSLLLGSTFGLDDIAWSAGAIGVSMLATGVPSTAAARPALLLAVAASAAAERTVVPWLLTSTRVAQAVLSAGALVARGDDVADDVAVVQRRHLGGDALAAFAGQLERAEVKWAVRKCAAVAAAALLLRAARRHAGARTAAMAAQAAAEARLQNVLAEALVAHEKRLFEALKEELAASARLRQWQQQQQQEELYQPFPDQMLQCDFPLPAMPRAVPQLLPPPPQSLALPPPQRALRDSAATPAAPPPPPLEAPPQLPTPDFGCDAAAAAASPSTWCHVAAAASEPARGLRLSPILERQAGPAAREAAEHAAMQQQQQCDASAAAACGAAPSAAPSQSVARSTESQQAGARKRRGRGAAEAGDVEATPAAKRAQRARSGASS